MRTRNPLVAWDAAVTTYLANRRALGRTYENGDGVQVNLPQVALYMGHVSIVSTHRARSVCTGGHFMDPYEQNTQQSPGFGRNSVPHPVHS